MLSRNLPGRRARRRAGNAARRWERRRLRHDRRKLRDEALLLRPADEGVLEDLLQVLDRNDLDLADVLVFEEDVLQVRPRDEDLLDSHLRGRLDLPGDTPHPPHPPPAAAGA